MSRLPWALLLKLSRRDVLQGVEVAVLWRDSMPVVLPRVEEALGYIRRYSPHQHERIGATARVLVFGTVGPIGQWLSGSRAILLRQSWVEDSGTHPIHIAATIVHEYTHAWIERRGIAYSPAQRRRIERMCCRAQARFALRVPGYEDVAQYYADLADRVWSQPDSDWSNAAFRERKLAELEQLGTPGWLMTFLRKLVARTAAV